MTSNSNPYIEALTRSNYTVSNIVSTASLLSTDYYQISMAYTYYCTGRSELPAVFEMFFRKCPFGGEYVVTAGVDKIIDFLKNVKFTKEHIQIIKTIIEQKNSFVDQTFYQYLENLDFKKITVSAIDQGTVVFPNIPIVRIEGPLLLCQLLETPFLSLMSFPHLVATNASRICRAAKNKPVVEFGLRRSQGLDGGNDATKYSKIGGVVATSNIACGFQNNLQIIGTNAHSFITGYKSLNDVKDKPLLNLLTKTNISSFKEFAIDMRNTIGNTYQEYLSTSDGELAAFIDYANINPNSFSCVIDSYDTILHGTKNYIIVMCALNKLGYNSGSVRIDSGDLAYLSNQVRQEFLKIDNLFNINILSKTLIIASNELSEKTILDIENQENSINIFAVGTNLSTSKNSPSLGMVYKLVEINGLPTMKFSEDPSKLTLPYAKDCYRFYNENGFQITDVIVNKNDDITQYIVDGKLECFDPFDFQKNGFIKVSSYANLLKVIWTNGNVCPYSELMVDANVQYTNSIKTIRPDILRHSNPTPSKCSAVKNYCKNKQLAYFQILNSQKTNIDVDNMLLTLFKNKEIF